MKKLLMISLLTTILVACGGDDLSNVKLTNYEAMSKDEKQNFISKLDSEQRSPFVKYTMAKELEAQMAGKKNVDYPSDLTVSGAISLGRNLNK